MKKYISLFLTLAMLFGLGGVLNGCSPSPAYRIGIITGSVLQEEEEYLTAEAMQEKYGDMVVTATYPDNFDKEQLLEISTSMMGLLRSTAVTPCSSPLPNLILVNSIVEPARPRRIRFMPLLVKICFKLLPPIHQELRCRQYQAAPRPAHR